MSPEEVRKRYDEAMRFGTDQYLDVLAAFQRIGLKGVFIQTGGMNAAIEISVSDSETIRLTDIEDALSWYRAEHDGWTIARYAHDPNGDDEELLDLRQTEDGSADAAVQIVQDMTSSGTPEASS